MVLFDTCTQQTHICPQTLWHSTETHTHTHTHWSALDSSVSEVKLQTVELFRFRRTPLGGALVLEATPPAASHSTVISSIQSWDKKMNYSEDALQDAAAKESQFRNFFNNVKLKVRTCNPPTQVRPC